MTTGGWFLTICGVAVSVFFGYALALAWAQRRRPVRTRDGQLRVPRRHPPRRPYGGQR